MNRLLLAIVWGVVLLSGVAHAQETPSLSSLDISLWPEFDRPDVLVIYRGLLAPETPLPASVEFRIPASAGEPTAVAYVGEDGQLLNQQHTTRLDGDWLVVSFELSSLGFQVEYYAPLVVGSTGQREFTYTYRADYPIAVLSLDIQVPPGAQEFVLEPAANSVAQESDGLTYHKVQAGALAPGESLSWTITYQKADSALTVESLAPPELPAQPPPQSQPTEATEGSTVVVFVIAFLALIAIGGGAFWLGQHTQASSEPSSQSARLSREQALGRRGTKARTDTDGTGFCHLCGARLRYDADFCHKCGTAVRKT
jgi:hypothetical protein